MILIYFLHRGCTEAVPKRQRTDAEPLHAMPASKIQRSAGNLHSLAKKRKVPPKPSPVQKETTGSSKRCRREGGTAVGVEPSSDDETNIGQPPETPTRGGLQSIQEEENRPAPMPEKHTDAWFAMLKADVANDHETEGEDLGKKYVRRSGLTVGGLVPGRGDMFYKSRAISMEHLIPLLRLRLAKLNERDLPPDGYLPFPDQKEIQGILYKAWRDSPDGHLSEDRMRKLTLSKDSFERNMKSQWVVVAYKKFGGLPWMQLLIAWGKVPKEMVDMYNDMVNQTIYKEAGRSGVATDYVEASHPTPRALAKAQGKQPPLPKGVKHKPSEPKRLREAAKQLHKNAKRAEAAWNAGKWHGANYEYTRLWADVKDTPYTIFQVGDTAFCHRATACDSNFRLS